MHDFLDKNAWQHNCCLWLCCCSCCLRWRILGFFASPQPPYLLLFMLCEHCSADWGDNTSHQRPSCQQNQNDLAHMSMKSPRHTYKCPTANVSEEALPLFMTKPLVHSFKHMFMTSCLMKAWHFGNLIALHSVCQAQHGAFFTKWWDKGMCAH